LFNDKLLVCLEVWAEQWIYFRVWW